MIKNDNSLYSLHNRNRRGGKSSFHMHDPELLFKKFDIKQGEYILDLGCGRGDYSIRFANAVGKTGLVCAVDKSEEEIENLSRIVAGSGIDNLHPLLYDITLKLPVENGIFDMCLISTVLHCLGSNDIHSVMKEMKRVMKPDGRVFVIECKKEEMKMGPPLQIRISSGEMEKFASVYSLHLKDYIDLGMNYMLQLEAF